MPELDSWQETLKCINFMKELYLLWSHGLTPAGHSRWWMVYCATVLHGHGWHETVSSHHPCHCLHLHGMGGCTWYRYRHAAQSLSGETSQYTASKRLAMSRSMPSWSTTLLMWVNIISCTILSHRYSTRTGISSAVHQHLLFTLFLLKHAAGLPN
jgi:FtsH-binding integral membrane protein